MNIVELGKQALAAAHQMHDDLGAEGETVIQKNQFGDTAVLADIKAEEAVIEVLKASGLGFLIVSEEHGTFTVGVSNYLAIIDGIDGSSMYKKGRGTARYGTMLGIFSNAQPKYQDYLFSGTIEHASNMLFYAAKGEAWMEGPGTHVRLSGSRTTSLDLARFYADEAYDRTYNVTIIHDSFINRLPQAAWKHLDASCAQLDDVAIGDAEFSLQCTRKGNLELAIAYGLIKEAGGVMVTLDGKDIGDQEYDSFGQHDHVPIIIATNKTLAKNLVKHLLAS